MYSQGVLGLLWIQLFQLLLASPYDAYTARGESWLVKEGPVMLASMLTSRSRNPWTSSFFGSNRTSCNTHATCLWLLQARHAFRIPHRGRKTLHPMLPQCIRPLLLCLPQKDPCPVAERWVSAALLGLVCVDNRLGVFSEKLLMGIHHQSESFNHVFLTRQVAFPVVLGNV